jgi:hypothetical protein
MSEELPEDPVSVDSGELPFNVLQSMSDEERGRYNFERWRTAFFSSLLRGRGVQAG